MELHKAIKVVINSKGVDMICNPQIINYLLDYQAFIGVVYFVIKNTDSWLTKSTIQRRAMPADQCQKIDTWFWDDTGYMQCLDYGAEPLPYDAYSVENSDISLSDICPTYKLKTDFINEDDGIETAIFIRAISTEV